MCIFLWRPIFTGQALLPGDYLMQMSPWRSVAASSGPSTLDRRPSTEPQWNPLQWDAIAQFYPWRVFYARSMKTGHIPLWNPHQFSGTPFLANGQSACLYPLNLIFLIFDPITALTIFAALHLFLAQVFMYWLMRELGAKELGAIVAAIVFAFSAFMVLWLELPTFISVAVWLPLALMLVNRAVERRSGFYGVLSGLVLGLTFLAGHFQIAFYVVLATGLWWLWKIVGVWRSEGATCTKLKVIWPLIGCIVIAGLIAAPQILPTQELAANSHRVRAVTEEGYQAFVANALPTYRLVTAFAPRFFGDPSQNNYYLLGRIGDTGHIGSAADYMEYGMYAGILPLMLALIALGSIRKKHVGFFVLLTALALLTALGTPINRLFYFGIPGFSALGGPNRVLLLYLFGVAALAGFGADYYLSEGGGRKTKLVRPEMLFTRLWLCASYLILIVAFFISLHIGQSVVSRLIGSHTLKAGPPVALALITAGWLFLGAYMRVPRDQQDRRFLSASSLSAIVTLLIIADLFAFGINYNPTCERSKVYPETKLTTDLKRMTEDGRRIAPINSSWSLFETPKDAILPPNSAMVYGLYDVQGYDSLYTKRYQEQMARVQGVDPSPPENGNMVLVRKAGDAFVTSGLASFLVMSATQVELLAAYPAPRPVAPNTVIAPFTAGPSYPGWVMIDRHGKRYVRWKDLLLAPPPDEPKAKYVYEPFAFRLGLFLMLVGVGALSCVGAYRIAKHRISAKR